VRVQAPSRLWRPTGETDLPTQQARSQAAARLPRPDGDGRRPQGAEQAPRPRAQDAFRLIAWTGGRLAPPRDRPSDATPRMEPQLLDKDPQAVPAAGDFGRLRRRAEFRRVSRGRRHAVEAFTLQAARREDADEGPVARIGITVTRKVGGAVVRNRIRRRLKEALRAATSLETQADHDYVLMARREALGRSFAGLVDDLRQAFRAAQRNERDSRRPAAQIPAKGRNGRP
jgi:ribonuclease P protein component